MNLQLCMKNFKLKPPNQPIVHSKSTWTWHRQFCKSLFWIINSFTHWFFFSNRTFGPCSSIAYAIMHGCELQREKKWSTKENRQKPGKNKSIYSDECRLFIIEIKIFFFDWRFVVQINLLSNLLDLGEFSTNFVNIAMLLNKWGIFHFRFSFRSVPFHKCISINESLVSNSWFDC